MREVTKKVSAKKFWINIALSLVGIGIILLFRICGETCSYLKASIFSIDFEHLGILFMGLLIISNLLKRSSLFLFLLSFGLGAEVYLLGFQIHNLIYCYYCISFGAVILILFLLNLDMAKKTFIGVSLVLGFVLFFVFSHISVTPLFAEETMLPSFGNGKIQVRLYTDYFCVPCGSVEPRLEKVITELVTKGIITITFIDTPIHKQTNLYTRYFLYVLNENRELSNALLARAALFEAARLKITQEEKLVEFLEKRKIGIKPFDVRPTFSLLNHYLRKDSIHATPICVISNCKKTSHKGPTDIMEALEHLPREKNPT